MDDQELTPPADDTGEFALGVMLGSRRAFAAVAGRCSAADAECLRRIRDEKLYLRRTESWDEFCPNQLGLSRSQANRIIRNLEEFGPDYFEIAQLTRITPAEYRAIAPAVRGQAVHVNGEAIALIPENCDRVAAAIAQLRQAVPVDVAPSAEERMAALNRQSDRLAEGYRELWGSPLTLAEQSQVTSVLERAQRLIERLRLECR
jgi:hypothetical protein